MQNARTGSHTDGGAAGFPQTDELDRLRSDARRACESLREIVNRRPRIVVLGEPKSGKTTLANMLVGESLLPASVVGNSRYPTLIRYADQVGLAAIDHTGVRTPIASEDDLPSAGIAMLEVALPSPRLKRYDVLDCSSGLNADELLGLAKPGTLQIPIWCTLATQAWKCSEQRAWLRVARGARARGMLAVTCCDRITDPVDRGRLLERLSSETGPEFAAIGLAPDPWVGNTRIEDAVGAHATRLSERRRMVGGRLARRIIRLGNAALGADDLPLVAVI